MIDPGKSSKSAFFVPWSAKAPLRGYQCCCEQFALVRGLMPLLMRLRNHQRDKGEVQQRRKAHVKRMPWFSPYRAWLMS